MHHLHNVYTIPPCLSGECCCGLSLLCCRVYPPEYGLAMAAAFVDHRSDQIAQEQPSTLSTSEYDAFRAMLHAGAAGGFFCCVL